MYREEYGFPRIWGKLAHAYSAETRLSSSSPSCMWPPESLGMRLCGILSFRFYFHLQLEIVTFLFRTLFNLQPILIINAFCYIYNSPEKNMRQVPCIV